MILKKKANWAYYVSLDYYDENGKECFITGANEHFPIGWQDFIKECNALASSCQLTDSTEKKTLTPQFFTDCVGYTDEDLPEGSLRDMIDKLELSLFEVTSHSWSFDTNGMEELVKRYGYTLHEKEIEPYCGDKREPIENDSNEGEFSAFVNSYLKKVDGTAINEIKDNEIIQIRLKNDSYCYLMQTKNMTQRGVIKDESWNKYVLQMDAGECGLSFRDTFYYNKDFKYIMTRPESVYDLLEFIG